MNNNEIGFKMQVTYFNSLNTGNKNVVRYLFESRTNSAKYLSLI